MSRARSVRRRTRRLLAASGLGAILCASCQHFEARALSPELRGAAFDARRLEDPGLRAFLEAREGRALERWPLPRWDLRSLTLAALYFSPEIAVARAGLRAAEAGVESAGARPNPSVSVIPELNSNPASGVTPWIAALSFDWPIETAGKRGHRIARAEHLADAAENGLVAEAWRLRAALRSQLVEWVAARERSAALERESALAEELALRLEQRRSAGAAASSEVAQARFAALGALSERADARRAELEALAQLAAAIGVPPAALAGEPIELGFSLSRDGAESSGAAELRALALQRRADLRALLAEYEASQAALQLEIARQYPDLHIGPGYQFDQSSHKWALGLSLELPLLDQNQGPIAEAEARRTELAARFEALQARIAGEIDRANALRDAAREQLALADRRRDAERARLALTRAAHAAGALGKRELREAELALAREERAHLDAELALQRALGDLESALQQPLDELPIAALALRPISAESAP